jgi:hypothetical protein
MKIHRLTIAAFALASWASGAMAGDFDGKKPMVCALLELSSCASGDACEKETPESVNVPRFIFIDAQKGTIAGTRPGGQPLTSKIERSHSLGDLLVLEGAEGAISWAINISQSTGKLSFGAVGDGVGFVVFGACVGASPN